MNTNESQFGPPLAGLCSYEEASRPGYTVQRCVELLKRYYYAKTRLAHLAASYVCGTPEWEAKLALSLHGWLDAEDAAMLRKRLSEMREPPLGLDKPPDEKLKAFFDELLRAADTLELLTGVFRVVRPALRAAYERHRRETNPLVDHPSTRILRFIDLEEQDMLAWGDAALATFLKDDAAQRRAERWSTHLRAYLAAAGGIAGDEPRSTQPLPPPRAVGDFDVQLDPKRDARFGGLYNTVVSCDVVALDDTRDADERNLALLFKRLREMDVPEMMGPLIAQTEGQPWDFYVDMLRQMWDEARHCMMGEVGLAARGVDWTKLPINVTFSYKANHFLSAAERHILLYAIEQTLMGKQKGKRSEWEVATASGDALSATFHDYDWADEVLHAAIGRKWMLPKIEGSLQGLPAAAAAVREKIVAGLAAHPYPGPPDDQDWWPQFAESVLGKKVPPVVQPDPDRPLSQQQVVAGYSG
ncbi:MAG TPA: hypothetical protein VGM03_24395 [Phycisphaerae bacterium]|jgi:hypothetical protein